MAAFAYSAYTREGRTIDGQLDAADRAAAFQMLDAQSLQPLSLKEVGARPSVQQLPATSGLRLKSSEVLEFTEEVAELLKGGLQLESALGIMERRKSSENLKAVTASIRAKLRDGESLSNSMRAASPSFGEMFCNLVSAGEHSGSLAPILARQATYLKAVQKLKGRVMFALIYPAFLVCSAIAVAILFLVFLIPKLMELLDSTGGSLPAGAQMIVNAAEFFKVSWPAWIVVAIAIFGSCAFWSKTNRLSWDRFRLSWPLIGRVLAGRFHVQFLDTMSTLVGAGLPLVRALQLTRNATQNEHFRGELDVVTEQISDGAQLSGVLAQRESFPALMSDFISVGEQTGDLHGALSRASDRFDSELTKHVDKLSALIQPAVVVSMAALVGAMAYLMVSAIFQTISGLGG